MAKSRGRKEAIELLMRPLGHHLISQALFLALKSMMQKPEEEWELRNMGDMMLIALELFPECFYSDAARQKQNNAEAA